MAKKKYPKKPKAPKASASAATHQKFADRMKDWGKACRDVDQANAAQERAAKKTADLKAGKGAYKKKS